MGVLLDQINGHEDLKNLSAAQLNSLSSEIRQFIINTVSKTGGHLASNLGVVELTLAMHHVFDFTSDKLLFDVGHQCYAHKIITGRKDKFQRIRKADGLSGFPDPSESEYDQFKVGHAGTSISTAIGMALGQQQQNKNGKIVALVGDASIVNGVSFEALNNLGLVKRQLLIVLNDNSMAIDATQGAIAKYFSRIRLSQTYEDLRVTTNNILEHLPVIGKGVEEVIERIKKGIRMVLPPSQFFESMDIPYFGPVDGHDIASLVKLFSGLAHLDHPAILHVYTKKGKGFTPAEDDRPRFHSTGPFKINGEEVEEEVAEDAEVDNRTFTGVFGKALTEIAESDEKVVAITSAMCNGTGLMDFREKFPKRFYDVGIAESVAVDIAAGMAKSGLKPVVCIYSTFLQRCFDQIFQEVALQNLAVVFCIDRAGFVGSDGPTHHGLMDIAFLRAIPNMVLTSPANDIELKQALEFALKAQKPVCIRYPKDFAKIESLPADLEQICAHQYELGKSVALRQSPDSAIAIVSYGCLLGESLKAADILAEQGIDVDVISARFAAPLDNQLIDLLSKGKAIITVEDHYLSCGFGSALLEAASRAFPNGIPKPVRIIGISREFIKKDTRNAQLMQAGISADNIVEAAKNLRTTVVG